MKHEDFAVFTAHTNTALPLPAGHQHSEKRKGFQNVYFRGFKRSGDIFVSLCLLPALAVFAISLLVVNPFINRGPLLYIQRRMGRDCAPFQAIKFRSMRPAEAISRGANCPVETDRITRLGHFLRKTRIDELPQVINVLKGDMSLIGPRPDYYEHACYFLENVPGYRDRHTVRPGISGLAQTEVGYVENAERTRKKVVADLYYIRNSSARLEAWVFYRTLAVIFGRRGQ